jgi:hypothetical protein
MKIPEDILKEWMLAVNEGNAENLMSLYHDKAILIPTFSNRLLSRTEKIREYFQNLCTREELSIAMHEKTLRIDSVRNDIYSACGIYCWRFAVEGELLTFEARFSYVFDLAEAKPILHHHSSQIPRTF